MEYDKFSLTICITSYNRPIELKRCLESISFNSNYNIHILVSDDCSPKRQEIKTTVDKFCESYPKMKVEFISKEKNEGYDANIKSLIEQSKSKYIVFITDDDVFLENSLDLLYEYLQKNKPKILFCPYIDSVTNNVHRVSKSLPLGKEITHEIIYMPILVSGIVIEKDSIPELNMNILDGSIYIQVYISLTMIIKHGLKGYKNPTIKVVGDGENGFGINDASEKDVFLADRKHFLSNISFNKGLIKVIKLVDIENKDQSVFKKFSFEFNKRSIGKLVYSSQFGKLATLQTRNELKKLDLNNYFLIDFYYLLIKFLGIKFVNLIYKFSLYFIKK